MPFDVFGLREGVTREYREYFESFVHIDDADIEAFARGELERGAPWPDAVLQLNPAYEPGKTLHELAKDGIILPETARLFGPALRLHRHQQEALEIARTGSPYVVTTGTGSGKSLTYLLPIADHVFRHEPEKSDVRALIVYPMNALINSQLQALERFRTENWPDCPVRFKRYTGQETNEDRDRILHDPPHILLTNYVMLEYMLIRPYEAALVATMTRQLQFVVMDELHVYRGRQGADVAMLMRRVRQAAGGRPLQYVGTSATLARPTQRVPGTRGSRTARYRAIAEVASTLFGVAVPPENVVDESLSRVATVPAPRMPAELRAAVEVPPPDAEMVRSHPLAAWVESTFGLQERDGRLVRQEPVTFNQGVTRLAEATGLEGNRCAAALQAGSESRTDSGDPVFAFRLHQFLASGSSIYATLEPPSRRLLTTEGQVVAPSDIERGGHAGRRLLFPLTFCRECGQEHYQVSWIEAGDGISLIPRSPLLYAADDDTDGRQGYLAPERDDLWAGDEAELPDFWLEERAGGQRVRRNYAPHVPVRLWLRPDGSASGEQTEGAIEVFSSAGG